MSAERPRLIAIAPGADFVARVAADILERAHHPASSLTDCTVVLAQAGAITRLRTALAHAAADAGIGALLGPEILPYRSWLQARAGAHLPSPALRELALYDLLRDFPEHFDVEQLWPICDQLLPLLDEIDLQRAAPRLARACARPGVSAELERELRTVAAVHAAWSEPPSVARSPAALVQRAFATGTEPADALTVFVGLDELGWLESRALADWLANGRALAFVQSDGSHPNPAIAHLLREYGVAPGRAVTPAFAFLRRALALAQDADTDATGAPPVDDRAAPSGGAAIDLRARWAITPCVDDEAQAQFVATDIEARLASSHGCVAVVAENRKLLRRVRALLEVRAIAVDDRAGWALSTTAAASAVERLLQCVEGDFHHQALLDLLQSPYCQPPGFTAAPARLQCAVQHLECDVMRRRQVHTGLAHYRAGLARADAAAAGHGDALQLLADLADATQALTAWHARARRAPAREFVAALRAALQRLGCWQALAEDTAGAELLTLLGRLEHQPGTTVALGWEEARHWLARALERTRFAPRRRAARVALANVRDADVGCGDILYLIGANEAPFPGNAVSAFFNDHLRSELGLWSRRERRALASHRLALLMSSAQIAIVTYSLDAGGEPLQAAQDIAAIDTWHRLETGVSLRRTTATLAPGADAPPAQAALLRTLAQRPAPMLRDVPVPTPLSAGAHQRLIDCPYLFYARDCLGLSPRETVREGLEMADYGKRVHAILRRFHADPSTATLLREDLEAARRRLEHISRDEFRRDLALGFAQRGWLQQWLRCVPAYVAWQAERAHTYTVVHCELAVQESLGPTLALKGTVDRVDAGPDGFAILDYKTGARSPSRTDLESGEDVQLITYALCLQGTTELIYLHLHRGEAGHVSVGDAQVRELVDAVGVRLQTTLARVCTRASLPAWRGPRCRYCELQGVCRMPWWQHRAH